MQATDFVIMEEDHSRFAEILERLRTDSNAKITFLLDKNGQQLARAGEMDGIDSTSLASLTAGNVAATEGLAKLIGENEFSILFHEGERDNLHINVIGKQGILLVLFDERSSLGLVRLRVRKATTDIGTVMEQIEERSQTQQDNPFGDESPFAEITDEDIDSLFS